MAKINTQRIEHEITLLLRTAQGLREELRSQGYAEHFINTGVNGWLIIGCQAIHAYRSDNQYSAPHYPPERPHLDMLTQQVQQTARNLDERLQPLQESVIAHSVGQDIFTQEVGDLLDTISSIYAR